MNHPVKPNIQQIRIEPGGFVNEDQTNFSIICYISANYSHAVDFLFRSDKSENFQLLETISSIRESLFTWVVTFSRKRHRESNGEYSCRDNTTNLTIASNIHCIHCNYNS